VSEHIKDIPALKLAQRAEIQALENIVKSLSDLMCVKKIIFFGSSAWGDFEGGSDMDILIIIADIEAKGRVISIIHEIELENDVPISPVIFTEGGF
jgi:predicted nucleotidyltransferase